MVYRVYVEKKTEFAVGAKSLFAELTTILQINNLTGVRILNRYDVEGVSEEVFNTAVQTILCEPPLDIVHATLPSGDNMFCVEYLPGQFDVRAAFAAECIQLISQAPRPLVKSARMYILEGELTREDVNRIENYVINPVEARKTGFEEKQTLIEEYPNAEDVPTLHGFIKLGKEEMQGFIKQYALAMDADDLSFCQNYFKQEKREPTLCELRVLDTYWSDHCRHTTFATHLNDVKIEDESTQNTYNKYISLRNKLYGENTTRPQTLMDIATVGAKALKKDGKLPDIYESEEINACTVNITAEVEGKNEDWLLLFKNETHNHPTEIEPFGGAATCIGGAIRDPLAGRGYVFGSMRVTGAANPLVPIEETLPGKLPQRKLCTTAAAGFSGYGNQIGLATGQVAEIYHPGYMAKRMELGAVLGAVRKNAVKTEVPNAGDVVLLVGGDTGRDGCGGATGSSKAHGAGSLESCGAEVQKGNAPEERKLQRLFRNPKATSLIRRCNDFGAGGVSVAIGELADGLCINLDAVPKKYDGLSGTELAISESQERMAVVVAQGDIDAFIALAKSENLKATLVAVVTKEKRLVMQWRGKEIANISREFLNTNGAPKKADAFIPAMPLPQGFMPGGENFGEKLCAQQSNLRFCSRQGLAERFDSTVGAGSILMPYGGRWQASPTQAMAMKLPVDGETTTCAGMAYGFDAYIMQQNPHVGAYLSVIESVAKLAGAGFALKNMYLTFQEFFERLGSKPARWGKPLAALLGALKAQMDLGIAAIGGKDSMSGSFEDLDVPPTLVSFAAASGQIDAVQCGEFQVPFSKAVLLRPAYDNSLVPNAASFKLVLTQLETLIKQKHVLSVRAVGVGGIANELFKMCIGNRIGFTLTANLSWEELFAPGYGSFIIELSDDAEVGILLGETKTKFMLTACGEEVDLTEVQEKWENTLESVYPRKTNIETESIKAISYNQEESKQKAPKVSVAKPKAFIPVFAGTNCEYDTARALRRAGGEADVFVMRNQNPKEVAESAAEAARRIARCQMLIIPGGFSAADEPEGSAKLITAFLRTPQVADALMQLLEKRDGLTLGICNGFQALIKLGLLTHGAICPQTAGQPTLSFNTIGRHQSMLVRTRISSTLSPWLYKEQVGAIHTIPVSHGEGRIVASDEWLNKLEANGQICAQYVSPEGVPTSDVRYNPPGSAWAIEAICSPNGRVLGKMAHTERTSNGAYKNVPTGKTQQLFEGGVEYFNL